MTAPSYDPGERVRVSRDAHGIVRVDHGAREIATIKPLIGGAHRLDADGRTWRIEHDDGGWTAHGDPPATFRRHALRSARLTLGGSDWKVRGRRVKGLLRFTRETVNGRPQLTGTILAAPPPGADAHALVALAIAALVVGLDLSPAPPHVPARFTPAAGHPG